LSTDPPRASVTVHVTEGLAPEAVALNWKLVFTPRVTVGGAIVTTTGTTGTVTVTVALADLVGSATLVAVTTNDPAAAGAVYKPAALTVPPVADQVTAVLALPVTVAVNCCVAFVRIEAVVGLIATATTGAAVTVTVALADLVGSATLVAVTTNDPAAAGAVYKPAALTVPLVADQVTAVLALPVTVAVNCRVALTATDAVVGLTVTATTGAAAVTATAALADLVGSATLVAVTANDPAAAPAVYRPEALTVPPVAVQMTAVFVEPVTEAANCACPPATTVVGAVDIATATTGAAVTVIVAVADLVASATLVAFTVKVPAPLGAVYMPVDATEPPPASTTLQVTAVFVEPVTMAANCTC
jgi:hypothetical protein